MHQKFQRVVKVNHGKMNVLKQDPTVFSNYLCITFVQLCHLINVVHQMGIYLNTTSLVADEKHLMQCHLNSTVPLPYWINKMLRLCTNSV
jgi:hypothetical protein